MKDVYERLRRLGFDQHFVRTRILPEWWDDSLGDVPSSRAMAELSISRMLGFPIRELRDAQAVLNLPSLDHFRLKHISGTKPSDLVPAILLATQSAKVLAGSVGSVPPFRGRTDAANTRAKILESREFVDLSALLAFAWQVGIVVLHLREVPKKAKKLSGLAMFAGDRPVIVLGSGRDGPAWISFHLAHEIGHVMLGHVVPGSNPIVDSDLDTIDNSDDEIAANRYACELLTGYPDPRAEAVRGLDGITLAARAQTLARQQRIDPGVIALVYGKHAARMGAAQNALKALGIDRGARDLVLQHLTEHLKEDLPETAERFVSIIAA